MCVLGFRRGRMEEWQLYNYWTLWGKSTVCLQSSYLLRYIDGEQTITSISSIPDHIVKHFHYARSILMINAFQVHEQLTRQWNAAIYSKPIIKNWELPLQWVKFNPCTNFSSLRNDNYLNPQDPFTEVTENPFQTFLTKVVLSISITFLVLSIAIWVSFKWVASDQRFTAWCFREKISRFADK